MVDARLDTNRTCTKSRDSQRLLYIMPFGHDIRDKGEYFLNVSHVTRAALGQGRSWYEILVGMNCLIRMDSVQLDQSFLRHG